MPAPSCRTYPALNRNLWLATSASAGASRRVGTKSFDQRCMLFELCFPAAVSLAGWPVRAPVFAARRSKAFILIGWTVRRGVWQQSRCARPAADLHCCNQGGLVLPYTYPDMQQDPMTLTTVPGKTPDSRILKLDARLTLNNLFVFQADVRKQTSLTILDLSAVPYRDCAGTCAIINYYVACHKHMHR